VYPRLIRAMLYHLSYTSLSLRQGAEIQVHKQGWRGGAN